MSEEPSAAPVQEQPTEATGAPSTGEATSTPEFFSENFDPSTLSDELAPAYKQMQGAFTKKTQELAEQRKAAEAATSFFDDLGNDETRAQAIGWLAENYGEQAVLEALGYATDEEEPSEDNADDAFRDPRVDELLAQREAEAKAKQEADWLSNVERSVEAQFKEVKSPLGSDLSEAERNWITSYAVAGFEPGPDGAPQVAKAAQELQSLYDHWQKGYVESKKAPHISSVGQSAIKTPNLDNAEERQAWMAQRLADLTQ